jgi:hypothetical protein
MIWLAPPASPSLGLPLLPPWPTFRLLLLPSSHATQWPPVSLVHHDHRHDSELSCRHPLRLHFWEGFPEPERKSAPLVVCLRASTAFLAWSSSWLWWFNYVTSRHSPWQNVNLPEGRDFLVACSTCSQHCLLPETGAQMNELMTCHLQNFQLHLFWLSFTRILSEMFRMWAKVGVVYANLVCVARITCIKKKWVYSKRVYTSVVIGDIQNKPTLRYKFLLTKKDRP